MNQDGQSRVPTPSLESVKELRLMAVFSDLVRNSNRTNAAEALGVNRKTIANAMATGRLSPRIAEALERMLLSRQTAAAAEKEAEYEALVLRVEASEADVSNLKSELQAMKERDAAREQDAGVGQQVEQLGRRVAGLESHLKPSGGNEHRESSRMQEPLGRGLAPQVVGEQPQPGEELVHGGAMPLILEWRQVRGVHSAGGKGVAWLTEEVRLLELEVALIEEFELTLPPEVEPLRGFRRDDHLRWRRKALQDARRRRAHAERRRWVRRILTLGLWWK